MAAEAIRQLITARFGRASIVARIERREVALAVWHQAPVAAALAVDALLRAFLSTARAGHWTVTDVLECGRRRLDADGRAVLLSAVTHGRHDPDVTPSWRADVEALASDAQPDPSLPWLVALGQERRWSVEHSLDVVVGVLVDQGSWPKLEPITATEPGSTNGADTAMLAKVRALLAKAESTEFEREAEAFTAKAQWLMARHTIDQAMLAGGAARTDVVVARVWIDAPYVPAKASLIDAVASANRTRVVLCEAFGFVTLVGEAGDVRATTLLAASLQVQATRAMTTHGAQVRRDGSSSTRSFRQSFFVAYADRIAERLACATNSAQDAVDPRALLPVLAARTRAVTDRFEALYPMTSSRVMDASDAHGWHAGRAAADLAELALGERLDAARP